MSETINKDSCNFLINAIRNMQKLTIKERDHFILILALMWYRHHWMKFSSKFGQTQFKVALFICWSDNSYLNVVMLVKGD